eukprot:UN22336
MYGIKSIDIFTDFVISSYICSFIYYLLRNQYKILFMDAPIIPNLNILILFLKGNGASS